MDKLIGYQPDNGELDVNNPPNGGSGVSEIHNADDSYKQLWNDFQKKYQNCWLVCDKCPGLGNGNLSWLMDKFMREEKGK
jgi:hypothetical protein